jgi:hypothetical protein
MINVLNSRKLKFKKFILCAGVIGIIIATIALSNVHTQSQKELNVALQKMLDENLDKNVVSVECYGDSYGKKLEYYRYGCNYIDKNFKNVGLSYIDEADISPPFWIMSPTHRLSMFLFRRAAEDGKKITVQFGVQEMPDISKLDRADISQQENLIKAVIRHK